MAIDKARIDRMNAAVDAINAAPNVAGRLAARDNALKDYDKATPDEKAALWKSRKK